MTKNLITLSLLFSLGACDLLESDDDDQVENTAAVFAGDLSGSTDTSTSSISGTVSVTDPDEGEAVVTALTDSATVYGSFSVTVDGAWTYTLDTANSDVAALASSSDTLTDTVSIESADGTTSSVVITISGVDPVIITSCTTDVELTPTGAIASHYDGDKVPGNVLDDDLDSTWAGNAFREIDGVAQDNVALTVKLDDIAVITQLGLIWDKGDERTTSYKIETSKDNSTWTEVLATTDSVQQSGAEGVEDVALTNSNGEYVRITGYGNSAGSGWTSLNDLTILGCETNETSTATNTDATIVGSLTANIDSDETTVTGTLTSLDLDGDTIVATGSTADQGTYGTFSIDADGQWTYTLDTTHATVAALAESATLAEQDFTVAATDGSEVMVAITIVGAAAPVAAGAVSEDFESYTVGELISDASDAWETANIKDSTDPDGTTTAEVSDTQANGGSNSLYLNDSNTSTKPFAYREFTNGAAASGSISFDVYTPSTNNKVTYINVGIGKNNSDRYFELRINGDDLEYEDSANGDVDIAENGFTQDAWHTIVMSWTDAGIFTVTLDGTEVGTAIDQSTLGLTTTNIPTQVTFYTGDNGGNTNSAYFDNIDSDLFDTAAVVSETFESYTVGEVISDESDAWETANIKDSTDPDGTTTAEVSDTQANGGSNSLYLNDSNTSTKPFAYREFTNGAAASGSISFDVYTPSTNAKVTYINVGIGKNNSDRYFELRINGDDLEYEDSANGDVDIAENGFTQDAWHTIVMSWTDAGIFTVTLDGTEVGTAIDQSTLGLTTTNIPTQITFYTGDNGGNDNSAYFDNINSTLLD